MKFTYINRVLPALLVCGLFSFYGCTDLEPIGEDVIFTEVGDDGVAIPDDAEGLVVASYNNLSIFAEQNNVYSLFQHTSDEMIPPTRGVDWGDNGVWRTLHAHNWSTTHDYVLSAWNDMNRRLFLPRKSWPPSPSAPSRPPRRASSRVSTPGRYSTCTDRFPSGTSDRELTYLPRVISRSDAIDQAIENVETAVDNLPSVGPGENIRGTKAAAYAC